MTFLTHAPFVRRPRYTDGMGQSATLLGHFVRDLLIVRNKRKGVLCDLCYDTGAREVAAGFVPCSCERLK